MVNSSKISPVAILIPILFIIIFLGAAGSLQGCVAEQQAAIQPSPIEANPMKCTSKDYPIQYVECGTCGAHVLEWWKVLNDEGSKWVNVCGKCYDNIIDEERTF